METQNDLREKENKFCEHCGELFEYCPHQTYGEPVLEQESQDAQELNKHFGATEKEAY